MARSRCLVASILLIAAQAVYGQVQTGNLYGKVQGPDGSSLPGVTVQLSGVGARQTFITDATGAFRFLNLSPGTYAVRAELTGMGSATKERIAVSIGNNTDVRITLTPTASEQITITADAPLLDTRKTGTGATITKVELENVPSGRDPWVILQQTPSVLLDRVNVGGSESGQQSLYSAKGVYGAQSTWNVDGVNITDLSALGGSPTYYDFDSFEEMQITTGSSDVRTQTAGVQLNMVTKRGTNDLKGSGRFYYTGSNLQSDPQIPSEAQPYLAHANQIDRIDDYGIELGGPIKRDRLWFWGAYSNQQINDLTAQRNDPLSLAAGRFHDNTKLETANAKFNAQPLQTNSVSVAYQRGNKIKFGRGVGPTVAQEAAWDQNGPTTFYKLEDTQTISSKLYLTGLFAHIRNQFQLIPDNGKRCTTLECGLSAVQTYLDDEGIQRGSSTNYITNRPSDEYRVDGSAFASSGRWDHELKFGFGYRKTAVSSLSAYSQDALGAFLVGDPAGVPGSYGGVDLFRQQNFTFDLHNTDAYVGDTVIHGNLTLQGGLRLDTQKSSFRGGSAPANAIIPETLPAISWSGSDVGKISWTNVAPRVAITYAMATERRTLLRAAVNRYYDQLGGANVTAVSPVSDTYQYLYYYFRDLNGDRQAQRNELCGIAVDCSAAGFPNGIASAIGLDPNHLTSFVPIARYANGLKNTHTDELILGIDRELTPTFAIGAALTYRRVGDFTGVQYEKSRGSGDYYTRNDYELSPTPAKVTFNGTTYQLPYYILKPDVPAPFYQVITNLRGYSQTYKGIDLTATKRLADRWMVRGSLSLNDWRQHVGPETFADPTHDRNNIVSCSDCNGGTVAQGSQTAVGSKGGVYLNSRWQYNVTGTYDIPVIDTLFGVNLTGRQGYPLPYAVKKVGADGVTRFLLIGSDVDTYRLQNFRELDLRLAKPINTGRAAITLSLDAFNVLNSNTVLQREVRVERSSRGHINEIMAPRIFRLGARVTF